MPDPTTTTAAAITLAAGAAAVPMVTILGIPLGLRADLLIAGFSGSLAAISLLNAQPARDDTWLEAIKASPRRMGVAIASSLTAGYLTPLILSLPAISDAWLLGGAFAIGCAPHLALIFGIKRVIGGNQEQPK